MYLYSYLFSFNAGSDEMKRKMYGTILIVGGGAKFENLGKWLQSRLLLQIPMAYRPGLFIFCFK